MSIKTTESGSTLRNRLCKSIILAIRRLMEQSKPNALSLDLAAFVVLALEKISESINLSATAWEKRDYWLKADQLRQEWLWADQACQKLEKALQARDWAQIAQEMVIVMTRLSKVQVSKNNRLGEPWLGAWEVFTKRFTNSR